MNILLLVVPLAPLVASLLILCFGQRFPLKGGWFTVASVAVSPIALLLLLNSAPSFQGTWLETGGFKLTLGLQLDSLSRLLAFLVTGVALLVSVYATEDMAEEEDRRKRFFCVFSFFVGAMLTLVLANSFVLLYAAWEGVGLASYLLIGFWYEQKNAKRAALKAFLLTRLGDMGLLLGWLYVLQIVGTTDIQTFLATVSNGEIPAATLTLVALLFFAGAIGKSAQLPLTAWLPDAMAGPTPVSALIHSATMVAAGVYLVLRLFPLFSAAPVAMDVVLWVGAVTALFAALVATQQTDLKRVLAWSTVSQLGEMMLALGLGGSLAAAYHLTTHAVFKSTLFLAAGAVDLVVGTRNLKQLGNLASSMPLTAFTFVAAAISLAGVPPFSAYWSEEAILSEAVAANPGWGILMLILIFLAGVYISRAVFVTFANWRGSPHPDARDPGLPMTGAMLLGAIAALSLGWVLSGQLEALLQFPPSPHLVWGWRVVAILASLSGLVWGSWRAVRTGPAPVLGSFPGLLEQGLNIATNSLGRLVLVMAKGLGYIETGLDRLVQIVGKSTLVLAGGGDRTDRHGKGLGYIENWLDRLVQIIGKSTLALAGGGDRNGRRGIRRNEQLLDRLVQMLGKVTLTTAGATDVTERRGFSSGLDRFASFLGLIGDRLGQLQTGKLYFYTLAVFVWLLAAGIVGALLSAR